MALIPEKTIVAEEVDPQEETLVVDPAGVELLSQRFNIATETGSGSSATSSPHGQPREEELPAKRARTTVPPYTEMPPSTWTTKVKGKNSFSSPMISVFGPNGPPRFALFTRCEPRGYFAFKMDLEPQNNPPSFLSGTPDPNKTSEGLDMSLTVTKAQEEYIETVEAWIRAEALAHSKEWFGRQYNEADIKAMYSSALKQDERYPTKIRAKVVLSGIEKFYTKIIFMKANGSRLNGAGWDFVKPLLGSNCWRGLEARANLELRSIWIVGKKFGPRFNFTDLLVMDKDDSSECASFPEIEELDLA